MRLGSPKGGAAIVTDHSDPLGFKDALLAQALPPAAAQPRPKNLVAALPALVHAPPTSLPNKQLLNFDKGPIEEARQGLADSWVTPSIGHQKVVERGLGHPQHSDDSLGCQSERDCAINDCLADRGEASPDSGAEPTLRTLEPGPPFVCFGPVPWGEASTLSLHRRRTAPLALARPRRRRLNANRSCRCVHRFLLTPPVLQQLYPNCDLPGPPTGAGRLSS